LLGLQTLRGDLSSGRSQIIPLKLESLIQTFANAHLLVWKFISRCDLN